MIRLKDVAEDCGVSISTVSYILRSSRPGRYPRDLCERVFESARRLRYQPNRSAQSLRSSRSWSIGIIAEDYANNKYLHNYQASAFNIGLSHFLVDRGYHLVLLQLDDVADFQTREANDIMVPKILRDRFFDGLIINQGLTDTTTAAISDYATSYKYPVIWWDANDAPQTNGIFRNEREVGRILMEHLLALNHKRIGYLWIPEVWEAFNRGMGHFSTFHRYEAYSRMIREAALQEHSIVSMEPDVIAQTICEHQLTAVITNTADLNVNIVMAAGLLGLKIPQQLSIATFDFEERMKNFGVVPGGVSYDRFVVGQKAGEMIVELIDNELQCVPRVEVVGQYRHGTTIAPAPL
jgi:LacI family transcriptional regulator